MTMAGLRFTLHPVTARLDPAIFFLADLLFSLDSTLMFLSCFRTFPHTRKSALTVGAWG